MPNAIIEAARKDGRTILSEIEAKQLLEQAGVPVSPARLAKTKDDAVKQANELGYPIVLKIVSPQITHKSDVGGVALGLSSADEVGEAFERVVANSKKAQPSATIEGVAVQRMEKQGTEVIVGMTKDPQFGPVMMFGLGGIFVEILEDVAFRAIPLSRHAARSMVGQIRARRILDGARGEPPVDREALVDLLLKVSSIVAAYPQLAELDLNPVIAYADGYAIADARIIVNQAVLNPKDDVS